MERKLRFQAEALLLLVLAVAPASSEENLTYTVRANDHSLDSVCVGVTAGIFPHPDPSLCDVFVSCTFEQPAANQCADGFIFDPIVHRCVQGDKEQCPDRTPEPDWSEFCGDVSYAFYAHPSMCWEFVFCSLGTANRYSCPLGEIWSQRDGACLPGSWDTCELVIVEASCAGQPDGVLPYPPDCSRYMRCENGHTTLFDCPRGEVFEVREGKCVVGNTETCLRIDNICQGELDGTVLMHPNECDLFVLCQGGSATAQQCPTGEILNVRAQFCAPGNADTCQFYPQETMCQNVTKGAIYPLPADCTQFVICTAGESITMSCPAGQILYAPGGSCRPGNTNTCQLLGSVCQDQPDGSIIAHPSLCEIYIRCQGGVVMLRSCPNQEILRPDAQFCVPGNPRTCEFEPLDRMCIGQMDSVSFPHPTECAMFVVCHAQRAQVQTCMAGSIYNAQTHACVPGNEATCEEFDSICSGRPDGIVPHPTKCTAYIYCSSGRPVFEQCSPGTIFKQGVSGCVVGDTESCTHATNICTDRADGTLLEHPNECNLIVMCMAQQPGVMFCPAGEIFNLKVQFCTPGDSKTCHMHPVETMCANRLHGSVYPHPSDCTQYVRCNSGQPIVTSCPVGHVLHAGSGSCRPGNTKTCEFIENVCQNQSDGLVLKHPSDCGHFVWCQGGTVSIQPCPVGEILRPDAQFCVPGDVQTCEFDPIDRMCIRKADYTRFPHPTDCSLFVACQGQSALVQSCPSGSVYLATTQSCVPGNEATCERFDNICTGNGDTIIPHPLVCTAYIHCFASVAVFEQCALGTVFHPEQGGCVVGNTKTCVAAAGLCEGQPDGRILPHPNECDLYLMCVAQQPAPLRCPAGEILNKEAQFCAPGSKDTCLFHPVESMCQNIVNNATYPYPDDCTRFVECNSGNAIVKDCPVGEILHGSSQSCRPGNTKTCEFLDTACQGHPDGLVMEHPSLCGQYMKCQQGRVTVHSCSAGEILRPKAQFCVPGDPSSCEFEPIERMCAGRPDGRVYPHPTDCRSFIRCQSSQPVVESCRPGTVFRATSQSCVAGNGNTCSFLDGTCAGRPDGVLPHPQGCDLFLLCTAGTTSALRCPEGEILHPEFLICATGDADDCTLAPVTTEPPIISVCEGRPDGNYTHPLLCYLYIRCTSGATDILSCPPNQIFVGAIRDCAPGNQGTCIPM